MKKLLLPIGVIAALSFFGCGNSEEKKQDDGATPHDTSNGVSAMAPHDSLHIDHASLVYVCPCGGCPEVKESKSGKCPKCEMDLVEEKK